MPASRRSNTTWIAAAIVLIALVAFVLSGRIVNEGTETVSGEPGAVTLEGVAKQVQFLEDRVSQLETALDGQAASPAEAVQGSEAAQAQEGPSLAVVTADFLNVRKSPEPTALKIGALKKNAEVEVLAVEGEWAQIKFESPQHRLAGWVSTKFIRTQGE